MNSFLAWPKICCKKYFLALSSWEGKISEDDLDLVAQKAPLMEVFGYLPEIHKGEYEQFISNTSQLTHLRYLTAEYKFKYVNRHKEEAIRQKISKKFGTAEQRHANWADFQNTIAINNPYYRKFQAKAFSKDFFANRDEFWPT